MDEVCVVVLVCVVKVTLDLDEDDQAGVLVDLDFVEVVE